MLLSNFLLFIIMYLISFHLVMSGDDWFLIWMGLEVNMMMFIMLVYERYSIYNIESCLKYFFIQSMGSALLMGIFYLNKDFINELMCLVMSYKIGAGPFFFWFPSICNGISWMSCFVLMCLQKIIPFILLTLFLSFCLFFVIIVSLFFGVFGSFNQKDLKQLIAYSSVYHLGWMMMSMMSLNMFWMVYLIFYMMLIFPLVYFFGKVKVDSLLDVIKMKYKKWFVLVMLSMAGMPPFLGFFLKWFAFISIFILEYFFWLVLVFSSIVMFYIYYRVIYDVLMVFFSYSVWINRIEKGNNMWWDTMSIIGFIVGMMIMLIM
uniref:NADH-ubiquinone oxidoreductase chain 2 n=1 Tax=Oxyopes hupingensis TaxID=2713554 RepID=A0A6G6D9W9_9ARAC|nr:NADH dehydrogenase subunit 2 [Oxyopes hupingensis]QIE13329.1 NADH dehydrogenase subunit 2 [Oxyopes hupingensis]